MGWQHACALGLVATTSCASIQKLPVRSYTERKVGERFDHKEPTRSDPGQRVLTYRLESDGTVLVAGVQRIQRCSIAPVREREEDFELTFAPDYRWIGGTYGAAALGFGLGGYFVASASGRPSIFNQFSRGQLSGEGSAALGWSLLATGVAASALATWAILTEGDTYVEQRVSYDRSPPTVWDCGASPIPDTTVSLQTLSNNATIATEQTDAEGFARFAIPLDLLRYPPKPGPQLRIQTDEVLPQEITLPPESYVAYLSSFGALADFEDYQSRFGSGAGWATLRTKYLALKKASAPKPQPKVKPRAVTQPALLSSVEDISIKPSSKLAAALGSYNLAPQKTLAVFRLDPVSYFGLGDTVAAQGGLKRYRNTQDFRDRRETLRVQRKKMSEQLFVTRLPARVSDYDQAKGTLALTFGANWGPDLAEAQAPKAVGTYVFPELRERRRATNGPPKQKGWIGPRVDRIDLAVTAEQAEKITENQGELVVLVSFRPKVARKVRFNFMSTTDRKLHVLTTWLVESDLRRLVIALPDEDEILFRKSF